MTQNAERPQIDPNGTTCYSERVASPTVEIGRGTYHYNDLNLRTWAPGEKIIIGNFCSISIRVSIYVGGGHGPELISTYPFDFFFLGRRKPHRTYRTTPNTMIGNDVWIGAGATILSGVHIGNGAIIGSASVVAKDVPAYGIVVGNPARVTRTRFTQPVIERLERIAWWNWSMETIRDRVEWFYRPINEFLREFDPDGIGEEPASLGGAAIATFASDSSVGQVA